MMAVQQQLIPTHRVAEVPENIDFTLTASIGKLLYENKVIEQLKGNVGHATVHWG